MTKRQLGSDRARRALVVAGRVVLWSAVAVVLARGAHATLFGSRPKAAPVAPTVPVAGFPRQAATAFATRCAHEHLTYDAAHPESHSRRVADCVADGADPQMGWDGTGRQVAGLAEPTAVQPLDDHQTLVIVAVEVTGVRYLYVAMRVVEHHGRMVIGGLPALVPKPPKGTWAAEDIPTDAALSEALRPAVESFFRAYAEGAEADLAYLSTDRARASGINRAVSLDALTNLKVGLGHDQRRAFVTVRWADVTTGARLSAEYHLSLVMAGGRWYVDAVDEIAASQKESR
jgi:hypothetical protein